MYHIICLSETYLDSSFPHNYPRLSFTDFKLVRADNMSHNKRGGVGISFKSLAVRLVTAWYYEFSYSESTNRAIEIFN